MHNRALQKPADTIAYSEKHKMKNEKSEDFNGFTFAEVLPEKSKQTSGNNFGILCQARLADLLLGEG
jgi:hypothetical protein